MKLVFKIKHQKKWIDFGPLMLWENGFSLNYVRVFETLNIRRIRKCLNKVWEW